MNTTHKVKSTCMYASGLEVEKFTDDRRQEVYEKYMRTQKYRQKWWLIIFLQEDNYLLDSFKDVRKSDVYVLAVELKYSPQKRKQNFSAEFLPRHATLCRNSDIASEVKFRKLTTKI